MDVAELGQVVCTEATQRLLKGHFACKRLGSRKLKGVPQPLELFRVQAMAAASMSTTFAPDNGPTPPIGRDHEVSLIRDLWVQAQQGVGQVVLLSGEPGVGKSRLVQMMKQHVQGRTGEREEDTPVIEWRCSPQFRNTRLYPAIDFYERALGLGLETSPHTRFERMVGRLEGYGLARPDFVSLWAALLSLPTISDREHRPRTFPQPPWTR